MNKTLEAIFLIMDNVVCVSVSICMPPSGIKFFSLHCHIRGPILKVLHHFIRSCQIDPLMVVFSSENPISPS